MDRFAERHLAVNVFEFDGCIIHQNADGESEATERHQVDRFPERTEDRERCQN